MLRNLSPSPHAWVDADIGPLEDAVLVRPQDDGALVLTVDFITPSVDDPETFGAIAAANALSDVYAMGGEPRVALAICGFPPERLPLAAVERIFRGGRDLCARAGCTVAGGHTLQSPQLEYGLCVLGSVPADRALRQTRGRAGDRLVLTKPLGVGVLSAAHRERSLAEPALSAWISTMTSLNRDAKDAALEAGVRAATDVTGFGLLGHLRNLCAASGLAARIDARAVPVLDGALGFARQGTAPGGSRRNAESLAASVHYAEGVEPALRLLLADAQTSGGLLLAVGAEREQALVEGLRRRGAGSAVIGSLVAGPAGSIEVAAS